MSSKTSEKTIVFYANKIYVHPWPLDAPKWSDEIKEKVNLDLHKNKDKKEIKVRKNQVTINDYNFDMVKKVGITVPLFKKETTMVFEAKLDENFAHVHITTKENNYLEIFNRLMNWKDTLFSE